MFKKIVDFEKVDRLKQLEKCREELDEFTIEVINNNKEGIKSEGADLIQTVVTMWINEGYNINDIEKIFIQHYSKEAMRGRKVVCLEGESFEQKIIDDLLGVIQSKEKEIEKLQEQNFNLING